MKLTDKVVLVTGAGSGIGRAVALALLARGSKVAAVDRNAATLVELSGTVGQGAPLATFVVDITDRAAVEALPGDVIARLGAIDAVLHCAGVIQPFLRLTELDYAAIERVFSVNWWGTVHLTKAFLPHLLARPEAHLAHVSSMGGFVPVPGQTVYGASKAAVLLFTEGLHAELRGTNVHVTVVIPGAVATNIMENSGVTMRASSEANRSRITTAESAARQIIDGVERNRFRVLVGSDAKLLDVLFRLHPRRAAAFVAAKMKDLLQ
jgi:short-subunit dehydrogenase